MLSPEPSSPPPRRRRRRIKRKARPPTVKTAPSPDLATAFHGLPPLLGDSSTKPKHATPLKDEQEGREEGEEGVDEEVGKGEEIVAQQEATRESHRGPPLLSLPKRRHTPLDQQVPDATVSSSSSLANFAFPPPAQAGPARHQAARDESPPLSCSAISSTSAAQQAISSPSLHRPIPPAKTVSPATRLRSRRGSSVGRVPDPQWAADVLEPIFRAEAAAAGAEQEKGKKGKKGKGKERDGNIGWHALEGDDVAPGFEGPLSTDEFILNVLPKTTLKRAKKLDDLDEGRPAVPPRRSKRSRKTPVKRKRQERPHREQTVSETGDDGLSSQRSLLDPADVLEHAPTPKLYRFSTFLGGAELDTVTSKEKDCLVRRAPYATVAGGKDPLSLHTASQSFLGQDRGSLAADGRAEERKRRRSEVSEQEGPVKRLPPGKDVRAPFITDIRETAFAALVDRRDVKAKQKQASGMKSVAEVEEDVDQVVDGAMREPRARPAQTRTKSVTLCRPRGGRVATLELGTAEEAGSVTEQNPRMTTPRSSRQLMATVPSSRSSSRKPPTSHLKYCWVPDRLPPPRRRNPLPTPSSLNENGTANPSFAPAPAGCPSRPLEKANAASKLPSSPSAAVADPGAHPHKSKETDFRFVVGCKAKKAPTVEAYRANAVLSSSGASSASNSTSPLALPSLQPGQSRRLSGIVAEPVRLDDNSLPRKRKRSSNLVTPGPLYGGPLRADSHPEGKRKRKKHALLRRLSTRPDFQLPTSPVPEDESSGIGYGDGIHSSSHEYEMGGSGGFVSLQLTTSGQGVATFTSMRCLPDIPISPELFADLPPAACQSNSLPAASGYVEDDSPSFLRQIVQAAETVEGVLRNQQDYHARSSENNTAEYREMDPRPAPEVSSSADSPLLRRRPFPILAQPASTQTSGIWSRIPSFPEPSGGWTGSEEGQPAHDELWSGAFSVDPDENEDAATRVAATPSAGAFGQDLIHDQQPPSSFLGMDECDQLEQEWLAAISLDSHAADKGRDILLTRSTSDSLHG
ncbi:hypothetical protein JCM11251_003859 [Rhodosporidiobolus azoricus]